MPGIEHKIPTEGDLFSCSCVILAISIEREIECLSWILFLRNLWVKKMNKISFRDGKMV